MEKSPLTDEGLQNLGLLGVLAFEQGGGGANCYETGLRFLRSRQKDPLF